MMAKQWKQKRKGRREKKRIWNTENNELENSCSDNGEDINSFFLSSSIFHFLRQCECVWETIRNSWRQCTNQTNCVFDCNIVFQFDVATRFQLPPPHSLALNVQCILSRPVDRHFLGPTKSNGRVFDARAMCILSNRFMLAMLKVN